jgi:hypothetical protein
MTTAIKHRTTITMTRDKNSNNDLCIYMSKRKLPKNEI